MQNNQNEVAGSMRDGIPAEADARSEIAAQLHEQFARLTRRLRTLELPDGMTPERLSALSVIEKRGPISVTALAEQETHEVGVDSDGELESLMLVEQAYAANARVLSVVDELMKLLLEV